MPLCGVSRAQRQTDWTPGFPSPIHVAAHGPALWGAEEPAAHPGLPVERGAPAERHRGDPPGPEDLPALHALERDGAGAPDGPPQALLDHDIPALLLSRVCVQRTRVSGMASRDQLQSAGEPQASAFVADQ